MITTGRLSALALLGLALVATGAALDPSRTAFAYLVAFIYCTTIALGALALVMIHHVTRSSWFIAIRRVSEWAAAPLLLLVVLFLPIAASMETLFPWTRPETLPPHLQESVRAKATYLNETFFLVRAALYLLLWSATAALLCRWSLAQDAGCGERLAVRQQRLAAGALPAVGLSVHFAATDWAMSLEPGWASSAFGVQMFAGGMVGALALLCLVSFGLVRRGLLRSVVGTSHFHALGKLLHTLVIFWAYVSFFQYMLIWIADAPAEVSWYAPRTSGRWGGVALLLIAGHFVAPFLALLSRELKRSPSKLAVVAAWLLAMHYADVYWLVMPAHRPTAWLPHYADLGALLLVGGLVLLFAAWWSGRGADAARGDPRFARSLRFRTN